MKYDKQLNIWLDVIWSCIEDGVAFGYDFLYGEIERCTTRETFYYKHVKRSGMYQYPYIYLKEDTIFVRNWFQELSNTDREILFHLILRTSMYTAKRVMMHLDDREAPIPQDEN